MSKRSAKKKKPGLHVPSFLGGLLLGGVAAAAIFAPQFLSDQFAGLPEVAPGQDDLDVVFEFPDILRHSEVPVDPGSYGNPSGTGPAPGPLATDNATAPSEAQQSPAPSAASAPQRITDIYIQAASFRDAKEADKLRAKLLLQGLPANQEQVVLSSGTWHRVIVGPAESSKSADKIIQRLREQNLMAVRINRK